MMDVLEMAAAINARKEAEALLELAGEQPQRFWEVIAAAAISKLPPRPLPPDRYPPMSEQEAIRFENESLPYGKHAGRPVGEVEFSYLLFLTEGDEFSKKLRRYVKSERFQRFQDGGE